MLRDLRIELQKITDSNIDVNHHVSKIEELRKIYFHSIEVLPSAFGEALDQYNCVMYALDLAGRKIEPYDIIGRFFANTEFLSSLIKKGHVKHCIQNVGNIITWSNKEQIKHVGLITDIDIAISKWGIGHLYRHGLYEIPESYGSQIDYYEPIDGVQCFDLLCKYYEKTL